ncbi:T9SS type A sorting domain-containing protein [Maribellus sediminis]|uniref:T9SS type A sorting domain-containing protein n=1 Tax=Maribellus sediminis TaxID=2696285 RepID=UPI001431DCCC|nr:T9SS type A sorting domain-containing protein [Maribellus sediminis]
MKKIFTFLAFILTFSLYAQDYVELTNTQLEYAQDFNSLDGTLDKGGIPWENGTNPLQGWFSFSNLETSPAAATSYSTGGEGGDVPSNGTASLGVGSDRALGFRISNAVGDAANGIKIMNNTSKDIGSITITYTGEQWSYASNQTQSLEVSYKLNASSLTDPGFVAIPELTFTSPITADVSGTNMIDGTEPANRVEGITHVLEVDIPIGSFIVIKWLDINDDGVDHILAIDDLTISAGLSGPKAFVQFFDTRKTYHQDFNTLDGTYNARGIPWDNGIDPLEGWYAFSNMDATPEFATSYSTGGQDGDFPLTKLVSYGTDTLDRALGYRVSDFVGDAAFGIQLKNSTSNDIKSLTITYTGEQWSYASINPQSLKVSYKKNATALTDTGFVEIPDLTFTSPVTSAVTETNMIDGNQASNRVTGITFKLKLKIKVGETIYLKWSDVNDSDVDHMLAIDDLTITAYAPDPHMPYAQFSDGSLIYQQDFNLLAEDPEWKNGTDPLEGWYAFQNMETTPVGADAFTEGGIDGEVPSPGVVSFGSTTDDKALGYYVNDETGDAAYGLKIMNNSSTLITSLTITYTGEQWAYADAAQQALEVFYKLNAEALTDSDFVAVPKLTFTSPRTESVTDINMIDGNDDANKVAGISFYFKVQIPVGEHIFIKWQDKNDAAMDHLLAIDDLTIEAGVVPPNDPFAEFTDSTLIYEQNFDELSNEYNSYQPWTNGTDPLEGWYAYKKLNEVPEAPTKYGVGCDNKGDGSQDFPGAGYPNSLGYAEGTAEGPIVATERALGYRINSSAGDVGLFFDIKNNTSREIKSIEVTYTGEQWAAVGLDPQTIDFYYKVNADTHFDSTFTKVDELTFTSLQIGTNGTSSTMLNGNLDSNKVVGITAVIDVELPVGATITLKWFQANVADGEHILAIDDLTVKAQLAPDNKPYAEFTDEELIYDQDFNGLSNEYNSYQPWTNGIEPLEGWYAYRKLDGTPEEATKYGVGCDNKGDGSQDFPGAGYPNSLGYAEGTAEGPIVATERALGYRINSSSGDIGMFLDIMNNTSKPIKSIEVTYTGEQWAAVGLEPQTLDFYYKVSADNHFDSTFTKVEDLTFTSLQIGTNGTSSTMLNGNLDSNKVVGITAIFDVDIPVGAIITLKWFQANAPDGEHILAIDDLTVKANLEANKPYAEFTDDKLLYEQNFNGLSNEYNSYQPWTNGTEPLEGWYAYKKLNDVPEAPTKYGVGCDNKGDGSQDFPGAGYPNSLGYTEGTAEGPIVATERALGYRINSSAGDIGMFLDIMNNTSRPITSIEVTFTGEQWAAVGLEPQSLDFYYKVDAENHFDSTFTKVDELTFTSLQIGTNGTSSTMLNGNLDSNKVVGITAVIAVDIPVGAIITLKWFQANVADGEHILAIDDLTVKAELGANTIPYAEFTDNKRTYYQNFDGLSSEYNSSQPWSNGLDPLQGWFAYKTLDGTPAEATSYGVGCDNKGDGTQDFPSAGNPNSLGYAEGTAAEPIVATERALGYRINNSAGDVGLFLDIMNNSSQTIKAIEVTYTGEQWAAVGLEAQSLDFYYKVGASSHFDTDFIKVDELSFTSLQIGTNGTSSTMLNGNLAENKTVGITMVINVDIPVGEMITLKWFQPNDPSGDHILAIDDLSVSATFGTAVSEIERNEFIMYRSYDYLKFSSDDVINSVRIYSITGAIMKEQVVRAYSGEISVQELRGGIYIARFSTENGKFIARKFVK